MHPSLSRPTFAYEQPMATDIKYLENKPGFEGVRERILHELSGNQVLDLKNSSMEDLLTTVNTMKLNHIW